MTRKCFTSGGLVFHPMQPFLASARVAICELGGSVGGSRMDPLDRWLQQYTQTPVGSLALFLALFLARLIAEQWYLQRKARRLHKRKKES